LSDSKSGKATMMKTILMAGAALAFGIGGAFAQSSGASGTSTKGGTGTQMTQAECQSLWSKAGGGAPGPLSQAKANAYVSNFGAVDTNKDGKLSNSEFMSACQRGLVHGTASSGASSGTAGKKQ
jgi:hypothetical protein